MALVLLEGFEAGEAGWGVPGSGLFLTEQFHINGRSLKLDTPDSGTTGPIWILYDFPNSVYSYNFRSYRIYIYLKDNFTVTGTKTLIRSRYTEGAIGEPGVYLDIDSTLTPILRIGQPGSESSAASSKALSPNVWYRLEIDAGWNSGAGGILLLNGIEVARVSSGTVQSAHAIEIGPGVYDQIGISGTMYVDDILIDNGSFTANGYPGDGHIVALRPVADYARGSGWTGGGGSTTNLWDALNNWPYLAYFDGSYASNTNQIINDSVATTAPNAVYECTLQTYQSAGVDKIPKYLQIHINARTETTTYDNGSLGFSNNPSLVGVEDTMRFGNGGGGTGFHSGQSLVHAAAGNESLTTGPRIWVKKTTGQTYRVCVDDLALMVEYPDPFILVSKTDVIQGDSAHDAVDSSNPIKIGSYSTNSGMPLVWTTVSGCRSRLVNNLHGVLFTLNGHPNTINVSSNYTTVQSGTTVIAAATGKKTVITKASIYVSKACSVNVGAKVYTATKTLLNSPAFEAGSGTVEGDGSGILLVSATNEAVVFDCDVPTGGSIQLNLSYFQIEDA